MTPGELREEQKWAERVYLSRPIEKKRKGKKHRKNVPLDELTFSEQIQLEQDAFDFAVRMNTSQKHGASVDLTQKVRYPERFDDSISQDGSPLGNDEEDAVGDLAMELAAAFKIIDRIVWFLKELDIEDVKLPPEIEKESMLLFREAKDFVDRMEYGQPLVVIGETGK